MKLTIRNLAKYLNQTESNLYYKKKHHKKLWGLLWSGWVCYIAEKKEDSLKKDI